MIKRRICWLIFLLLCGTNALFSQDLSSIYFNHLTTEDGLSHNTVNRIEQDKKGFLWLGTFDGLCRYDGQNVEVFRHHPDDTTSISNNSIWSLKTTSDGAVWVGTSDGLNRFDYHTGEFQRFYLSKEGGETHNVMGVEEDHLGNLWVATQGSGLFKITRKWNASGQQEFMFKNLRHDPANPTSISSNIIHRIHLDSILPNKLWIQKARGISYLDIRSEEFNQFDSSLEHLNYSLVNSFKVHSDSSLLVTVNELGVEKINLFTKESGRVSSKYEELRLNMLTDLLIDKKNKLWVSMFGGGLAILPDLEKDIFQYVRHSPIRENSLSNDNANSIFEDRDGNIWIGTSGGGCNYYNPNQFTFPLLRNNPADAKTICSDHIRAIFEDSQGNTWLGSNTSGISIMRLGEKLGTIDSIANFKFDQEVKGVDLSTHAFFEDTQKRILISGRTGGITIYDLQKKKFRNYIQQPNDLKILNNIPVYSYWEKAGEYLLFGSYSGLYKYDFANSTCSHIFPNKTHNIEKNNVVINTLHEDDSGKIFMGSANYGLYVFDPKIDQVKQFSPATQNEKSFPSNSLLSFYGDKNGFYWFGTWEDGLIQFDPRTTEFTAYTEEDGLINNTIYSIQADKEDNLWLSTNKGLCKFDPVKKKVKSFDTNYNLQGEEFNSRVGFTNKNGMMYFGGMTGLNIFNPEDVKKDTIPPKLYLTNLTRYQLIDGKEQIFNEPNIIHKKKVVLEHYDKTIVFKFSALQLPKIRNVVFAYQLEGFNKNWFQLNDQSTFNLTNLDQGRYTLKIKAASLDKEWPDQILKLKILVRPPWWETWWAYLIYILGISGILYGIYLYRLRQVMKYQRLRTKISSDLHDDVGSILTAVAMQTEILGWTLSKDDAKRADKISSLNRTAIERMRDTVWAIDARKDNVASLLDRMNDFIFEISESAPFTINFHHNKIKNELKIPPNVRQNIYLVFKEALNNAIKHSNGNEVIIQLYKKRKNIFLSIKDNGKVDKSQIKKSGLGLANMTNRAAALKADFQILTESGFEIRCNIPI